MAFIAVDYIGSVNNSGFEVGNMVISSAFLYPFPPSGFRMVLTHRAWFEVRSLLRFDFIHVDHPLESSISGLG